MYDGATTILVVDDDPILREFACLELAGENATILAAGDGFEALEVLRAHRVDIVCCDLHMPGLDGFGLTMAMRGDPKLRYIPLIMATTRDDMFAIDRAYEIGATSFVTKPINWRLLGHQMRYLLRMARVETDLRNARDRADEAARVKNNILAVMSHETRTPLGSILGFSDLIRQQAHGPIGNGAYAEYAGYVHDAGTRLFSILTDLQLFAEMALESFEPQCDRFDLIDIVGAASQATGMDGRAKSIVTLDPSLARAHVIADRRLIVSAIAQLLRNALTHAVAKSVTLSCEMAPGERVAIVIRDDGRGIEPAVLEEALRPFYERRSVLDRAGTGLGIGLPLAKRVATTHGGRLEIDSRMGEGTVARLVVGGGIAAVETAGADRRAA